MNALPSIKLPISDVVQERMKYLFCQKTTLHFVSLTCCYQSCTYNDQTKVVKRAKINK